MTRADAGASLVETLVVLSVMTVVLAMGVPVVGAAREQWRERQACQWLAGHFRAVRQQALLSGARTAVLFEEVGQQWRLRMCRDGNGDGVSRADIAVGVDACAYGAMPLAAWVPGANIGRDPSVPNPSGTVSGPVSFGSQRLVSFSPSGTSSSGTVVVQVGEGRHCAVRVNGVTGRVRVLSFDQRLRRWSE